MDPRPAAWARTPAERTPDRLLLLGLYVALRNFVVAAVPGVAEEAWPGPSSHAPREPPEARPGSTRLDRRSCSAERDCKIFSASGHISWKWFCHVSGAGEGEVKMEEKQE